MSGHDANEWGGAQRRRRLTALAAALLAVVLGTVVPVHLAQVQAQVAPPGVNEPPFTGTIISFPERDFVSADGWGNYPFVDVEVLRPVVGAPGTFARIGLAENVIPDAAGLVEVNHPGGACWGPTTPGNPATAVTPDIKPGDVVRLTAKSGAFAPLIIDQTTTANVVITQFVSQIGPSTVEMRGTARTQAGAPLPLDQIEARLIGSSRDRFDFNNRRDLRAPRDGTLTIDGAGNWVATIPGLSAADISRALVAENRIVWLGSNPAAGTEATIFEAGEGVVAGPQAPCTAPLQGAIAASNRTAIEFPATEVGAVSPPETIRITNIGNGAFADLIVSSVTVTGADGSHFGVPLDGCTGVPIAVGSHCDVQVDFRPSATGVKSAVVNIASNAGNTLVNVTATGLATGIGENIAFGLPSPATMGFGTRSAGNTSPEQTLTIRNIGNIAMNVSNVAVTGPNATDFTVVSGNCNGSNVNPNASCSLSLNFTPGAEGPRSASLQVTSNAAPVVVPLTGTGLVTTGLLDPPPPPIALGVFAARDFVSVEGFDPGEVLTLQIIRHGVVVGEATNTVVGDDGVAEVNHPGGDCWDNVTPNIRAGDILRVTRADSRAYQTVTADVKITQHAQETFPGSNVVEIKGYARDLVTGAPIPLDQLESRMIASSADPFSINDRRAVHAPGEGTLAYDTVNNPDGTKWTATYDFNSAPAPAHDAALAISEENRIMWLGRDPLALFEITFWEDGAGVADGPSAPCTAPGEPASPGIAVSPALHTYPQLTMSESALRTFTVRNIGTAPLTIGSVTFGGAHPADFSLQGSLPGPIAPNATGTFQVRFRPTGIGLRTATVVISDNAVGTPHRALVQGTGVLTSTPSGHVSPASLTFPDTQVGVDSAALSVTVLNEGGADLLFSPSPTIVGANASDFRVDATSASACTTATALRTAETCTVSVIYNPTDINTRAATLVIATNDPTGSFQVPLSGTASTTSDGVLDPPRAPHLVEVFPVRDYVAGSGFDQNEFVRFDVYRNGVLVGRSQIAAPRDVDLTDTAFDGFVEVNHVGGVCWDASTPDIMPGDVVRAVRLNGASAVIGADQTHVADLDVSMPPIEVAPGTVVFTGSAISPFTGTPLPAGSIEPRITSTTGLFDVNGRRDVRAASGADGSLTMSGSRWTATFSGLSAGDVAKALSGDAKVIWLGRAPLALNEITHWEWAELPGPDPGCAASSPFNVAEPTLTPASLSAGFGGLGAPTAEVTTTFRNPGPGALAVGAVTVDGLHRSDFAVSTNTCPAALGVGGQCTIGVRMTASALGMRAAAVKIVHDGANGESFLPVSGVGVGTPTITTITAAVGHGGTVVIAGTNLVSTSSVTIGGVAATFAIINDGRVDAIVPNAVPPALVVPVVVTTAGGTATASIQVLPDPPTIATVTPTSGAVGTVVTVTGTNLAGATVTFNGTSAAVTSNTGTQIVTSVPAGATTGDLRVVTAGGAATRAFTVIPSPVITGFTPASAKTGSQIVINGQNFAAGSTVRFTTTSGTVAATPTILSATQIRVTVPATAVQGPVTVTNLGGTGSAVFTVERAPSNITLAPTSGPVGSTVVISGFNFLQTNKVQFNGRNATSFTVVNQNTITAVVPGGATTGTVQIGNRWGTATSVANFTVIPAPTVTSFAPATAVRGITLVTVTGTSFTTATSVVLAQGATTVNVAGFTIVNATTIRFTVPAAMAAGLYSIRVTNPAGTGSSVAALSVV